MDPGSGNPTQKPSRPCKACRLRHIKCDTRRPSCSGCLRSGIKCNWSHAIRFRHMLNPSVQHERRLGATRQDYEFNTNQPWASINQPLRFVDETQYFIKILEAGPEDSDEIEEVYLDGQSSTSGTEPAASPHSPSPMSLHASQAVQIGVPLHTIEVDSQNHQDNLPLSFSPIGRNITSSPSLCAPLPEQSTALRHRNHDTHTESVAPLSTRTIHEAHLPIDLPGTDSTFQLPLTAHPGKDSGDYSTISPTVSNLLGGPPLWPRQDHQEAFLLRYFIESIAPMFDLCDNERHFARIVPQRAALCPTLFNAVLATSAKRLSKISNYDSRVADRYHQDCLKALIPALSTATAVLDENLLTAIVILRYMEEVGVSTSDEAAESHLLGTRAFLAAQNSTCTLTGLRLAAFWVALRQEVYLAFVHNRSVPPGISLSNLDPLLEPADSECSYANRIIVHCVACLRYCYGEGDRSVTEWEKLNNYQETWWREKPSCFDPLYTSQSEDVFLPETWYLNDAVVTGVQHYHLAHILLSAHNPKIPKLGPRHRLAVRAIDDDIKKTAREVCGIAESNPRTAPHYVNACIAITMAGDRFTERHEQEELYNFLIKTDRELGWPTRFQQLRLRQAWRLAKSPADP